MTELRAILLSALTAVAIWAGFTLLTERHFDGTPDLSSCTQGSYDDCMNWWRSHKQVERFEADSEERYRRYKERRRVQIDKAWASTDLTTKCWQGSQYCIICEVGDDKWIEGYDPWGGSHQVCHSNSDERIQAKKATP